MWQLALNCSKISLCMKKNKNCTVCSARDKRRTSLCQRIYLMMSMKGEQNPSAKGGQYADWTFLNSISLPLVDYVRRRGNKRVRERLERKRWSFLHKNDSVFVRGGEISLPFQTLHNGSTLPWYIRAWV